MHYNSFIYMWIDKTQNKYYIGSHFGKIEDGYLFGGIDIKNEYYKRPQDFERIILSYHFVEKHSQIRHIEKFYLEKYDVENNENFYNRTNQAYGGTHQKSIEKRLNDIDENGLNAFQRAAKKMVETRKSRNNYATAKIREYSTKKSDTEKFLKLKDKISKSLKGRRWINKNGEIKYVKYEEYQDHLSIGWSNGLICVTYEQCLNFAREFKVKSAKHWYQLSKIHNLPHNPNIKFKDDWISWEDFLGKEKMIKDFSYEECKNIALNNNITSQKQWQNLARIQKLPFNPQRKYKEWISWFDFLEKIK